MAIGAADAIDDLVAARALVALEAFAILFAIGAFVDFAGVARS
jgi:hypothetical protein